MKRPSSSPRSSTLASRSTGAKFAGTPTCPRAPASRSAPAPGNSPDPSLYFDENINGDIRPITLKEYEKLDPSGRLPTVYDADNWSFWSPPYDFAAGLRDSDAPAEAWRDGTPLLSPGPSRYIQFAFRLFSTFTTAPRIRSFTLQFGNAPAASQILGEVWPIAVDSFAPTEFTYVVRPEFSTDDTGFRPARDPHPRPSPIYLCGQTRRHRTRLERICPRYPSRPPRGVLPPPTRRRRQLQTTRSELCGADLALWYRVFGLGLRQQRPRPDQAAKFARATPPFAFRATPSPSTRPSVAGSSSILQ